VASKTWIRVGAYLKGQQQTLFATVKSLREAQEKLAVALEELNHLREERQEHGAPQEEQR
jgi:hypothetical protein